MKRLASFHPEAQQELIDAAIWYDDRREGLGDDFIDAVSAQVVDICKMPERFPIVHDNVRQAIIQRFPFVVYSVWSASESASCRFFTPVVILNRFGLAWIASRLPTQSVGKGGCAHRRLGDSNSVLFATMNR